MIRRAKNIIKTPVFKSLFALAVPIITANLFQALYQMTDSFWVGRLGGTALAAVSICTPIIFLGSSMGIGFAIAGSAFVAQYFGAKNHKMVSHSAAQTILMVIFISLFLSIIGNIFSPYILTFIGADQQIFSMSLSFLRISFIALISNFSFFIFQSIMRGIGRPKIPVYVVLSTVLLNFILDPLFIFGFKFIPGSGPTGAAMATLATQTVAATIGFLILFKGKHGIHLKFSDFAPDFKFIKKSFKVGLPASIEGSSRNLVMVLMTSLITGFGNTAVAAYGAGSNIIQVAILISIGLAVANSTLVGQNIGANRIREAVRVSKLSSFIAFSCLTLLGLITFIFARQLISFFIPNDIAVIETAIPFVRIVSLGFGLIATQMCFGGVFNAAGQTHISMSLTILSQWIFQIPFAYVLSKYTSLGLIGIWLALPTTNLLVLIISFLIYSQGKWQKAKLISNDDRIMGEAVQEV